MNDTGATSPEEKRGFRWTTLLVWGGVILFLCLLLVVVFWGLVRQAAGRPQGKAPDFTLQLFEGYEYEGQSQVTLSDLRGKVVVINFWAEWCVECKREADILEATWRAYREKGVVFIGVDWVDVEPEARKYLVDYDISYPNGPDLGGRIGNDYGLTGVPETFIIGKTGQVGYFRAGAMTAPELTAKLDELLAQ